MTHRRRRGTSPAAPASLPDDDNLLLEILLRLPAQPSSLPRASSVCRRWRRFATDPQFLRRFRAHHRTPPLLGVFERRGGKIIFTPILESPDRIPPERFALPSDVDDYGHGTTDVLGCRHGRVLMNDRARQEIIVCDPITGEQLRRDVPPEFKWKLNNGAVLCAAGGQDHVHGGCHSSPFKVVFVSMCGSDSRPIACVYSSETGVWGDLISTAAPCSLYDAQRPATFVGNALYWLCLGDNVNAIQETL